MSGKPYTMKEMKSIVDYLAEKKAYGEIKGKKMWLDFERSKLTDRSWQSLKETFLKRILPDIHNPYYQLSITQISSFRQGYDVETKIKNKLEVRAVCEESSVNAEAPESTEQPSTSNDKEVKKSTGEETKNSMNVSHHRSSAETIILDPCYETAEDIQRELESPIQNKLNNEKNEDEKSPVKSLRDFITYSEPLTPMLQDVIDDFATDDEHGDRESQLQIVEDEKSIKNCKNVVSHETDAPIEISSETDVSNNADVDNESRNIKENQSNGNEIINEPVEKPIETAQLTIDATDTPSLDIVENGDSENSLIKITKQTEPTVSANNNDKKINEVTSETENVENNASEDITRNIFDPNLDKVRKFKNTSTQNSSNTTTDTLIPNNQEALSTQCDSVNQSANIAPVHDNHKNNTKKRANSQEPSNFKGKKSNLTVSGKPVSISDTDTNTKGKKNLIVEFKSVPSVARKPNQKDTLVPDNKGKQKNDSKKISAEIKKLTNEKMVHSSAEVTSKEGQNEKIQVDDTNDVILNSDAENPCLKSVSLYDEQFSSMKYSDSSDEVITSTYQNPQEEKTKNSKSPDENEILSLKSNSDTSSPIGKKRKKNAPVLTAMLKSERDRALANVFGFSSGAVGNSRKRRISYQNRSARRKSRHRISSGSSDWTSESDTEFVSPPRGRRNILSKKYLKPKSARIFSLEEEGGLFVMYGKKIYPVVKDGKKIKNYVTYAPDHDSEEEEESYWKLKYIEEKKRTAKLKKLLHQNTDDEPNSSEQAGTLDLTRPSPHKIPKVVAEPKKEVADKPEVLSKQLSEVAKEPMVQNKMLKIKITKQNEEVQLEGHWSQIHPVLDHVVHIFHKENEPKRDAGSSVPSVRPKSSSSRLSTPDIRVDHEAHEKVNKLETEIFKEIESLDKRSPTPATLSADESNNQFVNKRKRGRPKKSEQSELSVPPSPEKKKIEPQATPETLPIEQNAEKSTPVEVTNSTSTSNILTRQTRTPKKVFNESTNKNESNVITTRTKSQRATIQQIEELKGDETDVRYKLPPSAKKSNRRSAVNRTQRELKPKTRYDTRTVDKFPSLENQWINDIESSQGYQDSDISPINCLRKKKKRSTTLLYRKARHIRKNRRRRIRLYFDEMSDQSSNSCPPNFNVQSVNLKNSSLNTDVYRSESFQLLMPKVRSSFKDMEKIEENPNYDNDFEWPIQNVQLVDAEQLNFRRINNNLKTSGDISDVDESSNVSLPPSPVLSIVQNISVRKNDYSNIDCLKDANEDHNEKCNIQNFNMANVEVSMPLMQMDCSITGDEMAPKCNANKTNRLVTESFLNKIFAVNLKEIPSMSESVTQKLRDLFLKSTQKLSKKSEVNDNELNKMDIDTNNTESIRKGRLKKRCSTPLKRKIIKKSKSKKSLIGTFIEEEHTESYSRGGRKSCPPFTYNLNTVKHNVNSKSGNEPTISSNTRSTKPKDNIIKVKIIRPSAQKQRRETNPERTKNNSGVESKIIDSGINDSDFLHDLDDSVKLIHNHSETCLQAHECIGDGVEYVEDSMKCVISVDNFDHSNRKKSNDEKHNRCNRNNTCESLRFDVSYPTCTNNVFKKSRMEGIESHDHPSHTHKNNDESPNSLITEDLSDHEPEESLHKLTKWYLLSEDENTNTNFAFQNESANEISCRSNFNQLFPIICAVPNFSAITEASTSTCHDKLHLDTNT